MALPGVGGAGIVDCAAVICVVERGACCERSLEGLMWRYRMQRGGCCCGVLGCALSLRVRCLMGAWRAAGGPHACSGLAPQPILLPTHPPTLPTRLGGRNLARPSPLLPAHLPHLPRALCGTCRGRQRAGACAPCYRRAALGGVCGGVADTAACRRLCTL